MVVSLIETAGTNRIDNCRVKHHKLLGTSLGYLLRFQCVWIKTGEKPRALTKVLRPGRGVFWGEKQKENTLSAVVRALSWWGRVPQA